jgi:hypothetical protein
MLWEEYRRLRVFENRVQRVRRIFGPKREEIARNWRRLHNEELHNVYVSPNIITIVKSGGMEWVGHVERVGELKNA